MPSICVSRDKVKKRTWEFLWFSALYLLGFAFIEHRRVRPYIIHTRWDDMIPFCEYFIIPYLLWFAFIAVCLIWFGMFQSSQREYQALSRNLAFGCTVFLIISVIFPNGQHLRPVLAGDNVFQQMVLLLYRTDTCTNVFPSVHVFNSVACCSAVLRNHFLRSRRGVAVSTVVLTVSIILATVFLKQHTVVDVFGALLLNAISDRLFYQKEGAQIGAPAWNRRLGVAGSYSGPNYRLR